MSNETTLDPLEGIVAVLNHGSSTGTNKFGLLLALLDLAPHTSSDRSIPLKFIAEKLIELHWDHTIKFDNHTVRQVTNKNVRHNVLTAVETLRGTLSPERALYSYSRARRYIDALEWRKAITRVARDTRRNPVKLLQVIDSTKHAFLFSLQGNSLVLNSGVPAVLVRYGPVLREMIESRFVRQVIVANPELGGNAIDERLRNQLFGSQREMPGEKVRLALLDIQEGMCLYTGERFTAPAALDHVLPWARVRLSALSNFLLTAGDTNSRKSDLLLAREPLESWLNYLKKRKNELGDVAKLHGWPFDIGRVIQSARGLYGVLRPGAVLWSAKETRSASQQELDAIRGLLADAA